MFWTDPVSSCLCCCAFIFHADLTGCDHASQQRALQIYLKDATRSHQILVKILILSFNPYHHPDSGGISVILS